jgi:FkbM family methyltransferase
VGANIGIHTCVMAKLGWQVLAFEPDPEHMKHLQANLKRNGVKATLYNAALSDKSGEMDFIRVLGNTTANHLAGARSYYGPGERIKVRALPAASYFAIADFAKIDAEGAEADILCSVSPELKCEYLVEIGSEENVRRIRDHFMTRPMWRQIEGAWIEVTSLADMPSHYRHGSLFIGESP